MLCLNHLNVKVVLSYWSYHYFSVDVKDASCLLKHTDDSILLLTEDRNLLPRTQSVFPQDFVLVPTPSPIVNSGPSYTA